MDMSASGSVTAKKGDTIVRLARDGAGDTTFSVTAKK